MRANAQALEAAKKSLASMSVNLESAPPSRLVKCDSATADLEGAVLCQRWSPGGDGGLASASGGARPLTCAALVSGQHQSGLRTGRSPHALLELQARSDQEGPGAT